MTPPVATIGPNGMPMAPGAGDEHHTYTERAGAPGRLRTANLVHAPASTNTRVLVVAVVVVLLVIVPGVLFLRAGSHNPAIDQLNSLSLPSWSAQHPEDHTSGSRYCIGPCQVTERTWSSDRPVEQTADAYAAALRQSGWSPTSACPKLAGGVVETCWVLDQNQLQLTVDKSACALGTPPENRTSVDVTAPTEPAKLPANCAQTSVHAKVTDQINLIGKG